MHNPAGWVRLKVLGQITAKRKQASRTPYAGARINAYRFREAYGVLRLCRRFSTGSNSTICKRSFLNAVCEVTAVLFAVKRKQASRTPYAGRGSTLTDFAKRMECSGLPALRTEAELQPLQTIIPECVCEDTTVLSPWRDMPRMKRISEVPGRQVRPFLRFLSGHQLNI